MEQLKDKAGVRKTSDFLLIDKKKDADKAHTGMISRQGDLFDLAKITMTLSRDFYKASPGIQEFLE